MSNIDTRKSFADISEDYAFFEQHTNEAETNAQAYVKKIMSTRLQSKPIHLLDFGCGDGQFLESILHCTNSKLEKDKIAISLVDPNESYLQQASMRLKSFTNAPVNAESTFVDDKISNFNIIISNHVLYYVNNLEKTTLKLISSMNKESIFLATVSGPENVLAQCSYYCHSLINQPSPFFNALDFRAVLAKHDHSYQLQQMNSIIKFPDTSENRQKILRFALSADRYKEIPLTPMLKFFEPYSKDGNIIMPLHDYLFIIKSM